MRTGTRPGLFRFLRIVVATTFAVALLAAGAASAQIDLDPVDRPYPQGGEAFECDPATGEVTWSLTWTNTFDVPITIDVAYYLMTYGSDEVIDLTDEIPTSLEPGQTVTVGPVQFIPDGIFGTQYDLLFSTELSPEPVPPLPRADVGYACFVPRSFEPPLPVPVEPRFTG